MVSSANQCGLDPFCGRSQSEMKGMSTDAETAQWLWYQWTKPIKEWGWIPGCEEPIELPEGSTVELIDYFRWFRLSKHTSKGKRCTLSLFLKPRSPGKYWLSRCCCGFVLFLSTQNREQKGNGKIVRGLRMVLLFTETWVPFPAPTWRCTTTCNSSSRGSSVLFWSLRTPAGAWCTYIHSLTHTYT